MNQSEYRIHLVLLSFFVCIVIFLYNNQDPSWNLVSSPTVSIPWNLENISRTEIQQIFPCEDKVPHRYYATRAGKYYVLHNYIVGEKTFRCDESITYTTHSEFTYLDNILPLLERWMGPISVSVYSPGDDFSEALKQILYLRKCKTPFVKQYVTFHIVFDIDHFPSRQIPKEPQSIDVDCSEIEKNASTAVVTYRSSKKLLYPVNVCRNVARENALTHYVFPSDIELYPSPGLIENFLAMVRRNDTILQSSPKKVFVSSIFELHENVTRLPVTKLELVEMLKTEMAIPFHKYTCPKCHTIPKAKEWMEAQFEPGLKTFHVAKRLGKFNNWEPIFIGTNEDPVYDERLSWEGRSDKMPQGFVFCLQNYDFHILDNSFLVHRPGIKRKASGTSQMGPQKKLIRQRIIPELEKLYGNGNKNHGCSA